MDKNLKYIGISVLIGIVIYAIFSKPKEENLNASGKPKPKPIGNTVKEAASKKQLLNK